MSVHIKRLNIVFLILLLSGIICMMTSCSVSKNDSISDNQKISDLEKYISEKMNSEVFFSSWKVYTDENSSALQGDSCFEVCYTVGDITFDQIYALHYDYSRAFGFVLSDVKDINTSLWSVRSDSLVSEARILDDLEGMSYLSGYSNGVIEGKRVLASSILDRDVNAAVGYDRLTLRITLNALDVHEIVEAQCEYLLDDAYNWYLFAEKITLKDVNVQSGVSEETITEGLKSLTLYREEEESTWSIGGLNRLTYEILSRELDSDESQEVIRVSFRGEGEFMYISGVVDMEFRFSSGWYLYDSSLEDSCETGLLYDNWKLTEEKIKSTIIEDKPLTYEGFEELEITENMLKDFEVSSIKISENGRYQTAYFSYRIHINQTDFIIEGYGKYELTSDGLLKPDTWSDTIKDISFSLSGIWYCVDLTEDYLAYHTLVITDNRNGTLEGHLTSYGVDNTGDKPLAFNTSCNLLGNITYGTSYELFLESWDSSVSYKDIVMPKGEYDIFKEALSYTNAHSKEAYFTSKQPTGRLSRKEIEAAVKSGEIDAMLGELMNK